MIGRKGPLLITIEQVTGAGGLDRASCPPSMKKKDPIPEQPISLGPPWAKASRSREDETLLRGPLSRLRDVGRAVRIFGEFLKGFTALSRVGPCVTVFGSARFPEGHRWYRLAQEVGARIGEAGFTVMTGGGPGVMEGANRGARSVGAPSIGCNIHLPHEQAANPFVDRFVEFHYFFVRKVMLVKYSRAFVVLPGGFGTLDELFETATLIQTAKIKDFPLVVMGVDYWGSALEFVNKHMVAEGTISVDDAERIVMTDSPEEAVEAILASSAAREGLKAPIAPRVSQEGEGE